MNCSGTLSEDYWETKSIIGGVIQATTSNNWRIPQGISEKIFDYMRKLKNFCTRSTGSKLVWHF